MQNKIIFIAVIMICTISAQDGAMVSIKTHKPLAPIYINEQLVAFGEYDTTLSEGLHTLKILEGVKLYDPFAIYDTISVSSASNDLELHYEIPEPFFILSEPHDAYLYGNDLHIGNTPELVYELPSTLVLKAKGFENKTLQSSQLRNMKIIMLQKSNRSEETAFHNSDLFKYLLGGVVILGGVSAYFKIKADDHYEAYERYGKQNDLDLTNQYDTISGISFGLLQVNFGYLLYRFLIEE